LGILSSAHSVLWTKSSLFGWLLTSREASAPNPQTEEIIATMAESDQVINGVDVGELSPTYNEYKFQSSFFDNDAPLDVSVGYLVVLGFGVLFSVVTTSIVYINKNFGQMGDITSEHFK
jgi:small basic protein